MHATRPRDSVPVSMVIRLVRARTGLKAKETRRSQSRRVQGGRWGASCPAWDQGQGRARQRQLVKSTKTSRHQHQAIQGVTCVCHEPQKQHIVVVSSSKSNNPHTLLPISYGRSKMLNCGEELANVHSSGNLGFRQSDRRKDFTSWLGYPGAVFSSAGRRGVSGLQPKMWQLETGERLYLR